MMRRIYLIRHAKPEFPDEQKYCIGTTDVPIGVYGRLQGRTLASELADKELTIFSSPLSRALETARNLSPTPIVIDELREMYAGEWDGLSFSEIKARWGELFELRGSHPELPLPGAEDNELGRQRFVEATLEALNRSSGDIAIVAHSTVEQALICTALALPVSHGRNFKLRYGSYSIIEYDGAFHLAQTDILPHPEIDRSLCLELLSAALCGKKIREHCIATAAEALRIAEELEAAGCRLDMRLIESSALLHDIARAEDNHPAKGADWLLGLGYPQHAEVIRQHHDLDSLDITEAAVVNIADKCISEDSYIGIEERFARSRAKCSTPQAVFTHAQRYEAACAIMKSINSICNKEVIK